MHMEKANSKQPTCNRRRTAMQSEFYKEELRPRFHYSTKCSWINDPNGLVYFEGVYHIYYQTIPGSSENNGDLHWGHATSEDLVHWTEQPCVLFPDAVGKMWSGTAAVDIDNRSGLFKEKGIIIAYSTDTQDIGIAYSEDGFHFTKFSEKEPVIRCPEGVTEFRDPHIFWYPEDAKWKMVVAGGLVRIYESSDLRHWVLCSDDKNGITTECPSLIRMRVENTTEEKWVLSLGGREYIVGSFNGKEFVPESDRQVFNEGPDTYAGITFANEPEGRIIMMSWLNRWWYAKASPDGPWTGCLSLPVEMRLLKIGDSYRLLQNPVREVDVLRGELLFSEGRREYSSNNPLEAVSADIFEMIMTIDAEKSSEFELGIRVGEGDDNRLIFSPETMTFTFDRTECKNGSDELKVKFNPRVFTVSKEALKCGEISFRILVDRSNVEIFISGGIHYFVERIQPSEQSRKMYLKTNGTIHSKEIEIYKVNNIWEKI